MQLHIDIRRLSILLDGWRRDHQALVFKNPHYQNEGQEDEGKEYVHEGFMHVPKNFNVLLRPGCPDDVLYIFVERQRNFPIREGRIILQVDGSDGSHSHCGRG